MSYIGAAALQTRLREVLIDSRGVLRTVPAARFVDYPEGLDDVTQVRRAFAKPLVRADVRVLRRSKNSPPVTGNLVIYDIQVAVTSLRTVERKQQLTGSLRDTLMAAALTDQDVIRQALEYPGNLTTTQAGTATGLVSGMLCLEGDASLGVVGVIDDGAQKLESKLTFSGWLKAAPAV